MNNCIIVAEEAYCSWGEIESCEHYLMECGELQDFREGLTVKMWQQMGMNLWSMEVLLAVTKKMNMNKRDP